MSDSPGLVDFFWELFSEEIKFYMTCQLSKFLVNFFDSQKKTPQKDLNCLDMPRNWLTDMHMKMHLEE